MLKKIVEILIVTSVIAGVVGVYFYVSGGIPVSVTQTQKMSTFDVSGEGKVVVKPDQATVSMGVTKESGSIAQATEQVDSTMAELSKELKGLGIKEEDIKTTNYNVYENYRSDNQTAKTYVATSAVAVTIRELENTSAVIDLAGSLGLENVGGISFGLSDDLRDETVKEAREIAIKSAKDKAEELAGLAGMRLGRIVNVQEGYMGGVPAPMMVRNEMAKDSVATTEAQIEVGTNEVSVNVTLSYETL